MTLTQTEGHLTREQITAMLDGLDGVLRGPWRLNVTVDTPDEYFAKLAGDIFVLGEFFGPNYAHMHASAAHIARCDPDTIRALCTLALEALELRAENERLRSAKTAWREAEADVETLQGRIEKLTTALRRLSFAAQTTGGTAGRDEGLQAAIAEATAALERKPE